jgi:hypothetical protein
MGVVWCRTQAHGCWADLANWTMLTGELSKSLSWLRRPRTPHDPSRVLVDLTIAVADLTYLPHGMGWVYAASSMSTPEWSRVGSWALPGARSWRWRAGTAHGKPWSCPGWYTTPAAA